MAADAGLVRTDEDIIAIGGFRPGRGHRRGAETGQIRTTFST